MGSGHTHEIILAILFVLPVAGCTRVQEPARPDVVKNAQVTTSDQQPMQSRELPKAHVVRSRFEPAAADGELNFTFDVSPAPQTLPSVRWVAAAGDSAKTLTVRSDETGRYTVVLSDVAKVTDGQLLIELVNPGSESFEIHRAEFALREYVADRPASRPSRDGRFQVFTKPEGVSPELRLLIGSSEQPIERLPSGVTNEAVAGVYTVDFLPAANPDGWLLTMPVPRNDAHPALHFLGKGQKVWRVLDSRLLESPPLLGAGFAGAGTYLLVRETKQ